MAQRFDAILFDLDGTLVDSAPDIHASAVGAFVALGLPEMTLAQARSYVGHGAGIFLERARADMGIGEEMQAPLLTEFLARYDTAVALTNPFPGVEDLLHALAPAGVKSALVTNKPISPTNNVLAHFGWTDLFQSILGGDSLPVRKPDPAPLVKAIEDLGCSAPLYVGDSEVDAETAARAGVPFALFTEGYRKAPVAELPHMHAFEDFTAFRAWLGL